MSGSPVQTVFIPAAGLGSRLRPVTERFPKALVPVGGKPVISHVIDLYPNDTRFVVAVGYLGAVVSDYLALAHAARDIDVVRVKNFDGRGSGLRRTIVESVASLSGPFAFHAVDSILVEPWWYGLDVGDDAVVVGRDNWHGARYRRARLSPDGSCLAELCDPSADSADGPAYTGVCRVADIDRFTAVMMGGGTDPDDVGECAYLRAQPAAAVRAVTAPRWHDVGTPSALRAARQALGGAVDGTLGPKTNEATFILEGTVVKVHSQAGLAERKRQRAEALADVVPAGVRANGHCLTYPRVAGRPLSEDPDQEKLFPLLLDWLRRRLWGEFSPDGAADAAFTEACRRFYRDETRRRLGQLPCEWLDTVVAEIDGVPVGTTPATLFDGLPWQEIERGVKVRWHGDVHSDNVLVAEEGFVLIDWRHDFGGLANPAHGDLYYELGKLRHTLIASNHVIDAGLVRAASAMTRDGLVIETSYDRKRRDDICLAQLRTQVETWMLDWRRVVLVSGLVFMRMSPLYERREVSEALWALGVRELAAAVAL